MPKESLKLIICWYSIRNSPGTKDLSLRKCAQMGTFQASADGRVKTGPTRNYLVDAALFPNISAIFYTMHMLYEDMKLNNASSTEMKFLLEFLHQLAMDFELEQFKFHYLIDNPDLVHAKAKMTIQLKDTEKLLGKDLIGVPVNEGKNN
jgi:hypothetical protein